MATKQGRNPMARRHSVGGSLARPGTPRPGQSASRRPITASRPANRPTPNVLANAADTSRDAQKLIRSAPSPMQNAFGTVNIPAPANRNYSQKAGLPAKGLYGSSHGGSEITHVGAGNTRTTSDMLAAVGEPRLPKGYHSVISGFPGGAKKQAGTPGAVNKGASARDSRRVRQTGY